MPTGWIASRAGPAISNAIFFLIVVLGRIDHADGAADLRRHPELRAVLLELGKARTGIDEHVGDDLARARVDEMRHVRRFGRVDEDLAVRADRPCPRARRRPALRPAALARSMSITVTSVVVFVGDVEDLPVRILRRTTRGRDRKAGVADLLRSWCRSSRSCRRRRARPVQISGRRLICDAARALPDLDGAHDLHLVGIDDRDRVALLVRDIGGRRLRVPRQRARAARPRPSSESLQMIVI